MSQEVTQFAPSGDSRIFRYEPLVTPEALLRERPLAKDTADAVKRTRGDIRAVLEMNDDRLLVVVGPCSIHDPVAALDYARRLAEIRRPLEKDLLIVMRVYFEKPRTVTGWKGLINDPYLNGNHDVSQGLRVARQVLLDIAKCGLPAGCEWLDPVTPQYLADIVSWGAIGARTTESQIHRQLASGLSMPVGFKNATDGEVQVAVDACRAAAAGHTFFGATPGGVAAVVATTGNKDCHIILRGGRNGPNYHASDVSAALDAATRAGLPRRLMVDASHGNSQKDHRRQPSVAAAVARQVAAGEQGIVGIMLESFIEAGRQELGDPARLVYGQSVTDSCMDLDVTNDVLHNLSLAVRRRRDLRHRSATIPLHRAVGV